MPRLQVSGKKPARLNDPSSVTELPPPGRRPNCVSSHPDAPASLKVEPLSFNGTPDSAMEAVREVVAGMPRVEVQYFAPGRYLYATFASNLFQFTDDFECLVRPDSGHATTTIDVRSASRVGYGDMGVNKQRVERIRAALDSK